MAGSPEPSETDNAETVAALEHALRLARTGHIRAAVLFLAYEDDRHAFQVCDVRAQDVLEMSLMMRRIGGQWEENWFENHVTPADELPLSLAAVEDEEDS